MPVLADFVWDTPAAYAVERSAVWGVLVVWWDMCAVTIGRETTLREVPFGGYRLVIGVNNSFWGHTSSAWRHDQLLEDFYAIAPGGGPPISAGEVHRSIHFYPSLGQYVVVISAQPNGDVGMWWRFPPASENAGSLLLPPDIPPSFYTVPDPPGVLFPVPFC